jgi:hypothetical protein
MSKRNRKNKKDKDLQKVDQQSALNAFFQESLEEAKRDPIERIKAKCEKIIDESSDILAGIRIVGLVGHDEYFSMQNAENPVCHDMLDAISKRYSDKIRRSADSEGDENEVIICGECMKKFQNPKTHETESDKEADGFEGLQN